MYLPLTVALQDVHGGLEQAVGADMNWSAPLSRVVVHIADAPGHGRQLKDPSVAPCVQRYNKDDTEELTNFDADGSLLRSLMLKLREDVKVMRPWFSTHV